MRKFWLTSPPFFLLLLFLVLNLISCENISEDEKAVPVATTQNETEDLFFRISRANWFLRQPILSGEMDPMDFAQRANEMSFEGIEYMIQL